MNTKSNTLATAIITACIMLCAFALSFAGTTPAEPTVHYNVENLQRIAPRDYQIQITDDGKQMVIYDGDRFVGALPLNMVNSLGRIISIDND